MSTSSIKYARSNKEGVFHALEVLCVVSAVVVVEQFWQLTTTTNSEKK